jgi:putative flippase GtrA
MDLARPINNHRRGILTEHIMNVDYQFPLILKWITQLPLINRLRLDHQPKEVVRFLKFATVGAIGMAVDLSILYLMREHVLPRLLSQASPALLLAIANTISFSTAVLSNFTWNRLWTFPETRDRPLLPQLGQFALVNVLGWGINQVVLLSLWRLVFERILPQPLDYLSAKIIAIGIVLFWNYFVNRAWTYRGIH